MTSAYFERVSGINNRFANVVIRRLHELPGFRKEAFDKAVREALKSAEEQLDMPYAGATVPGQWTR